MWFVQLLQLRVLRFGFFEDGNVGVGVFPEGEEVLVAGARFRGVAQQGIGSSQLEMGQRAQGKINRHAPVVDHFLELDSSLLPLPSPQVRPSPDIDRVKSAELEGTRSPMFIHRGGLQQFNCPVRVAAVQLHLRSNRRQPVCLDQRIQWRLLADPGCQLLRLRRISQCVPAPGQL